MGATPEDDTHLHAVCGLDREAECAHHVAPVVGDPLGTPRRHPHPVDAESVDDVIERLRGLQEHGWRLKSVNDMLALRHHLVGVLEQAEATTDPSASRRAQRGAPLSCGGAEVSVHARCELTATTSPVM